MGQGGRRVNPMQAVLLKRQSAEERRAKPKGVYGRADIVYEARERELHRTGTPTNSISGFEYDH